MKTVSDVKAKSIQRKEELMNEHMAEGRSFSLEMGTKKVLLAIDKRGDVRGVSTTYGSKGLTEKEVFRPKQITLGKFEANLKENLHSHLFIELTFRQNSDITVNPMEVTGKEIAASMKLLVQYWLDYYEVKKAKAVHFMLDTSLSREEKELCKNVLVELGVEPFVSTPQPYNIERFYPSGMKIREETAEELNRVLDLTKQVENFAAKEPTFNDTGKYNGEIKSLYKMGSRTFYFANENFRIVPEAVQVKLLIDGQEERIFQYSPDVIERMLNELKEENSLANIVSPPTHHLENFLSDKLNQWPNKDVFDSIAMRADDIIGTGKTEEEMVELYKLFGREDASIYSRLHENSYSLFRIKTKNYYWHILTISRSIGIPERDTLQFLPTTSEKVPDEFMELIQKSIIKQMEIK